jgi:hypothetical protein
VIDLSHSTLLLAKGRLRCTAGQMRFDDLAASAEKLPGRTLPSLGPPSESAVSSFAIYAFFLGPPSTPRMQAVVNEQGGMIDEWKDDTHRTSDNMVNDRLFGVGS